MDAGVMISTTLIDNIIITICWPSYLLIHSMFSTCGYVSVYVGNFTEYIYFKYYREVNANERY